MIVIYIHKTMIHIYTLVTGSKYQLNKFPCPESWQKSPLNVCEYVCHFFLVLSFKWFQICPNSISYETVIYSLYLFIFGRKTLGWRKTIILYSDNTIQK